MKRIIIFLAMLLALPLFSLSSQSLRDTVTLSYLFDKASTEKECVIEVPTGCDQLHIKVQGELDEGGCEVRILDADGYWQQNFTIGHQDDKKIIVSSKVSKISGMTIEQFREFTKKQFDTEKESFKKSSSKMNGVLSHRAHHPKEGQWKVVMLPMDANAEIKITYSIQ